MVSVIVVDSHPVVRQGLKALLSSESGYDMVGEACGGIDALQKVETAQPDIVFTEVVLKGMNGIEVTRQLSRSSPETRVIIFSALDNRHYVLEAIRAGAKAYLLKESPPYEIFLALNEVINGRHYISPDLQDGTVDSFLQMTEDSMTDLYQTLTIREKEVLLLSAQGKTSEQIAAELFVSKRTVEVHRASMMHKLGLKKQHELVLYTIQKGLLPAETPLQTVR